MFFFEKKNQKTFPGRFARLCWHRPRAALQAAQRI
jgi:hypothetical protein